MTESPALELDQIFTTHLLKNEREIGVRSVFFGLWTCIPPGNDLIEMEQPSLSVRPEALGSTL